MQNGASDVLNQFRQGDVDAFEGLFRRHQRAVYGWIQRITRDAAAAEELTVETFWRIHRAHARFDPAQGFEGWARRIATRAALDWLRMTRARHTEIEEQTHKEVAAALGISVAAVKLRVFRALRMLRTDLEKQGITP